MRTVARYMLRTDSLSTEVADDLWDRSLQTINSWMEAKGELVEREGDLVIQYPDGRLAKLEHRAPEIEGRTAEILSIVEPVDGGYFETSLTLYREPDHILFYCQLRAGSSGSNLEPFSFQAITPKVVRSLVELHPAWRVGETTALSRPMRFMGRSGGERLSQLIQDGSRGLPLVLVSEYEGFLLHPGLDTALSQDLCGVAIVGKADLDASWELTKRCGLKWSCFNGATRLYWPGLRLTGDSLRHPVWTADHLMGISEDTRQAALRIRGTLRRRILAVSALSLREPRELVRFRTDDLAASRGYEESEELYQMLEQELDECRQRLEEALAELDTERARSRNLSLSLRHVQTKAGPVDVELAPATETPPLTVADAVDSARQELPDDLVFGADVENGVSTLARDAGPPEKILRFLRVLGELAREHRQGPLGTSIAKWLTGKGCTTSGESDTIRNNGRSMERRTWDDGAGSSRPFDLHMKPSDATSPDRCVRIYFAWDSNVERVVVGWVGRNTD